MCSALSIGTDTTSWEVWFISVLLGILLAYLSVLLLGGIFGCRLVTLVLAYSLPMMPCEPRGGIVIMGCCCRLFSMSGVLRIPAGGGGCRGCIICKGWLCGRLLVRGTVRGNGATGGGLLLCGECNAEITGEYLVSSCFLLLEVP